ncbi:Neuropeptide Y receptor family,GPCR, rhodopsin-like, 7TM,G protein-coupled receptor, rhodopsin-like [Cinara cedri]|uniref:Neuropeptide Y receptor family,GPCR, rhodopsin-like, 7TM,G protein-coupled receptor, rhodopsin-like n=1 Tax=Cinara cedri TaxID=506608 RepID=A0A5E4MJN6_9HEMI|nr:Neuropeptide Y receptor family,GPCR, rhodopsin-like, 7TM,G protein-coupled receptor, rhodopsin-like [Cinara cedri]
MNGFGYNEVCDDSTGGDVQINNETSVATISCNYTINSTDSYLEPTILYDVPVSIIVLLSMFYGTISVMAVVGNALVIWIVSSSVRMHNVTNLYIANLALADIVIGLFSIPFQFQAALLQRWNLPEVMCPFCPFVQVLSVNVSIFTLTAIAIDRHRAILSPLSAMPSKFRAKVSIGAIWTIAFALATPMAVALRVTLIEYEDEDGRKLVKPFCHNVRLPDHTMLSYRVTLLFVQYLVPVVIITVVYMRMALRLWGSHAPGNAQDSRDANLMRNKKKVIKMLVIVVGLFVLCWLPLQTYNVLQDIFPSINQFRYINIVFFCCDWLAMSNSCYNPFIYGIYNEKFKREFRIKLRHFRRGRFGKPNASHGRSASCRSTTLSEWKRGYSTRTHRTNVNGCAAAAAATAAAAECSPRRDELEMYVYKSGKITLVKCGSHSDLEELCL